MYKQKDTDNLTQLHIFPDQFHLPDMGSMGRMSKKSFCRLPCNVLLCNTNVAKKMPQTIRAHTLLSFSLYVGPPALIFLQLLRPKYMIICMLLLWGIVTITM